MTVAIGLGLMDFPFAGAGDYWRWVDMCEQGGVDSIWQTDRLVSKQPILECMTVMAALAGRTRRLRFGPGVAAHGSSDMPTWGGIFQYMDNYNQATVQKRIKNLCDYLISLQEK